MARTVAVSTSKRGDKRRYLTDCTGTATVNIYHGTTLARTTNLNLVWDDNQKKVRAIFLTAGTVITIDAKKIFHEAED